ncbi:MAG TPA: DUF3168 domain-containing protein [Candidatus Competibacter phosphatis]|nr:DUF3168 domain-containing protein [Candidatus Competibacter phosphatis]
MLLGDLLYTRLTTDATLTATLSTRVYPYKLPQSPTLPAATYQIISRAPTESNTQIFETRVQLDCWASTYDAAHALANLVQSSLRFYRKTDDDGNRILSIYDANQGDAYDDDQEIWRVIVDVIATVYEA